MSAKNSRSKTQDKWQHHLQNTWQDKWRRNDIAFHQPQVNPLLQQYLPSLKLCPGDQVLVPLCGKSVDMDWFIQQGLSVIGVEVSAVAIAAYFATLAITPKQQVQGNFIRWQFEQRQILCGDIFDLRLRDLNKIKLVYDCAALTALPPQLRILYVAHLRRTLPSSSPILLMTVESSETNLTALDALPSAQRIDSEVSALYQKEYQIKLLHGASCVRIDPEHPSIGPCALDEKVYLLNKLAKPLNTP
ncbi:MAG TPA: thiopurine S-methyltransferase [Cellvibrionaceae bacterium]|nr:thiopurine S-methyltransferase [Cellvibrionaceae bacterium]HMW71597.1 thiopurine S-methyltransferase [Cellvibrionaceae bacterium]HNG60508.1 thiopurine S-methyltransferase [Cellvibrionaceae bacterium]